jgi:nitroreductase
MNVTEAIARKRAVRSYRPEAIQPGKLDQILDAGRRAQSSRNTQPWRFILVEQVDTLTQLAKLGNYSGHLAQAAAGICILTSDPAENVSLMFDAGQAAAYMQLAALELGLGSCLIKLHHPEAARDLLGFPKELHLHFVIALGYPENPSELEHPPRKGGRQPFESIAHFEHWGRSKAGNDS